MLDISKIKIPQGPGVYIFKDAGGRIIYIGKAKNLPDRVKSYFPASSSSSAFEQMTDKTRMLATSIASVEFIRTSNEVEALVLESNLIKTHYPKFNIDLKDSHHYTYLKITSEKFPRLLLARRNKSGRFTGPAGKVYGPYAKGSARLLAIGALRKMFKVRTCKTLPKAACLQYYLGNCDAPCIGKTSQVEYQKNMAILEKILSSPKHAQLVSSEFEQRMKQSAAKLDFESARHYRDSISVLRSNFEEQKFESDVGFDEDYIAIFESSCKANVEMFNVVRGVVKDRKKYEFAVTDGEKTPLEHFLSAYYSKNRPPKYIYVSEPAGQEICQMLCNFAGQGVHVKVPQAGEHSRLMGLLMNNVLSDSAGNIDAGLVSLQKSLNLGKPPFVIECFDISNLFGTSVVGSMSRFVNGKPDKAGYRRFKIKSVEGQDDFASIEEIIYRRYARLTDDTMNDEGEKLPDLVLIDGGPGQLSSALSALSRLRSENRLQATLSCASLAKEFEEIHSPDFMEPLRLSRKDAGLKIL
ncbi:excinuclease ABC subunit UvrC, partial [Candidatus Parvarchaeota archaeon]|nr:excinuclease ABC subunit UvrC [Candidatus Parvarchaeota archaeon]